MNWKWQNIFKLLKTILAVTMLVVCLTACGHNQDEGDNNGAGNSSEELQEQHRACWQGSMLSMFYNAMSQSSMTAWPHVTRSAMPVIMVAFAVWLSFRVLKHVSSLNEESPAEVWTEVGRMAFMCLFCGILASSETFLVYTLNTFIFPIYYTFLEYGARILELTVQNDESAQMAGQILPSSKSGELIRAVVEGTDLKTSNADCLIYTNADLVCKPQPLSAVNPSAKQFPQEPSRMMQCLACTLSDRMQIGTKIGNQVLGAGSLSAFLAGLMIIIIFFFVKISFIFYMVDSIFRMCIIVILLPLLIMAVPFKATRKWSKLGFETIINSSAVMMCLAVVLTMGMLAMQTMINDNADEFGNKQKFMEFSIVVIALILIGWLILKSCGLAVAMAGKLVGGGGSADFEKKIGKMLAWTAKKLVSIVSFGFGRLITAPMDALAEQLGVKQKASKAKNALNKLAGRDKQ